MKRLVTFAAAGLVAVALTACAYHHPSSGPKMVYYDGAYGAYYGGFWGADGGFYYYTDTSLTVAKRDDAHHFHEHMQTGDSIIASRSRDRNAERVANGQAPLQESAELRHYVH